MIPRICLLFVVVISASTTSASAGCYSVEHSTCVKLDKNLEVLEAGECATHECARIDSASFEFIYKGESHYIQLVADNFAFDRPMLDGEPVSMSYAKVAHSSVPYEDEDDIFTIMRPNGESWIIHRHVGQHTEE